MRVLDCEMERAAEWALNEIGRMGYSITPVRLTGIEEFVEKPKTVISLVYPKNQENHRVYLRLDRFGEGVRYFDLVNYEEIKREHREFVRHLRKNVIKAYNFYHRKCYDEKTARLITRGGLRVL